MVSAPAELQQSQVLPPPGADDQKLEGNPRAPDAGCRRSAVGPISWWTKRVTSMPRAQVRAILEAPLLECRGGEV